MNKRRKEIVGIVLMSISLFCILSVLGYDKTEIPGGLSSLHINSWFGIYGINIAYILFRLFLGYYSIFLCIIIFLIGFVILFHSLHDHLELLQK